MPYFVYILYSKSTDLFYKGQTSNVVERLLRHNQKRELATAAGAPWVLLWKTSKQTRSDALLLERKLKNLDRSRLIAFMKKYNDEIAGPDELLLIDQLSGC